MAPSFAPSNLPHTLKSSPKDQPYNPPPFSPSQHLCYTPPTHSLSFTDLHLSPTSPSSPIAITTPFPLLTPVAVRALRADIFRPSLVSRYGSWKYPGVYRIRGYGSSAPFTYALWKSEELRQACSHAAGVELEVIMDYEIGQLNVQLPESVDRSAPITHNLPPADPPATETENINGQGEQFDSEREKDKALVSAWHHDSYPYVCVLMLSNPHGMVGGETALRPGPTHPQDIVKIKAPQMGYAVMMQGGAIEHAALPCLGKGERITFVTSFRARDARVRDESSLRTVRGISRLGGLYGDWSAYRLQVLEGRVKEMRQEVAALRRRAKVQEEREEGNQKDGCVMWNGQGGEEVQEVMRAWVREQVEYLERTVEEML